MFHWLVYWIGPASNNKVMEWDGLGGRRVNLLLLGLDKGEFLPVSTATYTFVDK